jgi:hypothetical protein
VSQEVAVHQVHHVPLGQWARPPAPPPGAGHRRAQAILPEQPLPQIFQLLSRALREPPGAALRLEHLEALQLCIPGNPDVWERFIEPAGTHLC